jgi:hypothetical protein
LACLPASQLELRGSRATSVYANAMLGNWLLRTGGSIADALQHFNTAVRTGHARPFVRELEFGGLLDLDKPGARSALIKTVNEMRKSGETIDDETKKRIMNFCFDPMLTGHRELIESLSAVPHDEAWTTYLWLNGAQIEGQDAGTYLLRREFIEANVLEISGRPREALIKYQQLQKEMTKQRGSIKNSVNDAVDRLSHK